jgi:ribosomal protein L40E
MQQYLFCPRCQNANPPNSQFCFRCGNKFIKPQPWSKTQIIVIIVISVVGVVALAVGIALDEAGQRAKNKNAAATTASPSPTPPLSSPEALTRAKQLVGGDKDSMAEAIKLLQSIPKEAKEYKEAQPILKRTTEQLSRIMAEEYILGPKPENSAYDGSVRAVDKYLERVLNDYDDSEYLEWSPVTKVTLKGEPYWAVRLKLRAKNAFGAKIVKDVIFFIRQNQVVRAEGL